MIPESYEQVKGLSHTPPASRSLSCISNSFIAPDESYLIFTGMDRSDSLGGTDLYISFRTEDGGWTNPVDIGAPVNTPSNEMCPQVSRDGRFLFWNSRPEGNADNYWTRADLIAAFKARVGMGRGI